MGLWVVTQLTSPLIQLTSQEAYQLNMVSSISSMDLSIAITFCQQDKLKVASAEGISASA